MEGILTKYAAFVLVMLATFTDCQFTTLNVVEGDVAYLNFSYSCNSTEVTLQRGNGAHIYNSENPTPLSSSSLRLVNETDGKICFLYLTISPVTRDDQGGYVLFAYKNGPRQFEDDRILLVVAYPPGKASCELSEEHIDPDWVRLQCTAPIGNIGGFIMCYQNGAEISPLNPPQEHNECLSQTLLAKVGDLVFCCSSILDLTKDRCECKDSVWDPIQKKRVTNVTDPCPPIVTTVQYLTFSQHPTDDNRFELTSLSTETLIGTTPQINSGKAVVPGLIVVICVLVLVVVILIVVLLYCYKKNRKKPAKHKGDSYVEEEGTQELCISKV